MTELNRQNFRLMHRLRVRWAEVDQQGIVFNPHYLMYIDTAFTEYWRALAIPYEQIPRLLGGDLYVKKSTLQYHGSGQLDDMLDIGLKCSRIGNSSMVFHGGVFRGDTLLVDAELIYVFADPATQTPRPVPDPLRTLVQGFEAGEQVLDIRVGSWQGPGVQAGVLRRAVFQEELHIPPDLEQDANDLSAIHALLCNRFGQPISTARLTQDAPGVARISRVAVSRAMRCAGFGRAVVQALMRHAAQRGDSRVVLSSQRGAAGFYTGLGFAPVGAPFVEAGQPHVEMSCTLSAQ